MEQIENASSGFDIEKAGAVLLDRVMKTKETVAHIRDEELQHVVAERNQATEKVVVFFLKLLLGFVAKGFYYGSIRCFNFSQIKF